MARAHSNLMLIVGASLLALGIGNTLLGLSKLPEYRAKKHAAVAIAGDSARRMTQGTAAILDPATDAQLLFDSAFTKYEYYRVVLRGGIWLTALGLILIGGVTVRRIFVRTGAVQS
ncbi:MAG TPA: hypothetical protein VEC57_01050 [Candidatus Limnocylindrales bacterium]|nr:hypothetical protein [Candidatus Limnocylindrales bacterium]